MRFYQETTQWADGSTSNHIYVLDKGLRKMFAYIQKDSNEHKVFKKPITIDPRGRTFKDLGAVKGFKIAG
jgi:hypothetical protein